MSLCKHFCVPLCAEHEAMTHQWSSVKLKMIKSLQVESGRIQAIGSLTVTVLALA